MKRAGFAIAAFVAIGAVFLLLMIDRYGPKELAEFAALLLMLLSIGLFYTLFRFFWLLVLVSLAALVVAKVRKWSRLRTLAGALKWLAVASVVTWVWLLLVYGPLNFSVPLTNEFKVYRAECQGWLFRPGESIGGYGTCFGSYKSLGGASAYKVDVPHQKVWIWEGPVGFEPNGGWVSLTQRSADPAEQKTCEVLDYSNWACTDSDQYGTTITQLVGGREHSYEYGKPSPSGAVVHGLASLARCDVQVDELTYSLLWPGPFGIWGSRMVEARPDYSAHSPNTPDWIDCTKPPP
jgi:hypothetical protein